jgi:hypothetical protein
MMSPEKIPARRAAPSGALHDEAILEAHAPPLRLGQRREPEAEPVGPALVGGPPPCVVRGGDAHARALRDAVAHEVDGDQRAWRALRRKPEQLDMRSHRLAAIAGDDIAGTQPAAVAGRLPLDCRDERAAARGRRNAWASTGVTSCTSTPMRPRVTAPYRRSCSTAFIATSIGTAKERPIEPPLPLKIIEFIPTTSPLRLKSGPPEWPGFIATSVWMNRIWVSEGMARAMVLTTPAASRGRIRTACRP